MPLRRADLWPHIYHQLVHIEEEIRAWGALLGRQLAERGIIVACIDYRNLPQGTISDMVSDAFEAFSFICDTIASYGGDPNQNYAPHLNI